MSRQSKMRRKAELAKQFKGNAGPARTQKKTTKRNTWFAKASGKVAPASTPKRTDGGED